MEIIIASLVSIGLLIIIYMLFNKVNKAPSIIIDDAILNHDELMKHAKLAAKSHNISGQNANNHCLYARLNDNYVYIFNVYKKLYTSSKNGYPLCPGSEWLLDNFYVIEQEIKSIRQNIDSLYMRKLPVINDGYLKNYPRIFAVALEMVVHTEGRIDKNQLTDFIESYQSVTTLTMSELWSLHLMLKVAVIEKLRKTCERIQETQSNWEETESLRGKNGIEILQVIKDKFLDKNTISPSYIEHLLTVLRKDGINQDDILEYINIRLQEINRSIEGLIHLEHQEQAGVEISIGNSISSLRMLTSWDWREIFDSLSYVEKILLDDPSDIYKNQDFETKDFYRHKIEEISSKYNLSETYIASKAIKCAKSNFNDKNTYNSNHVGYYIIGEGKNILLSELLGKRIEKFMHPPVLRYILPIIGITLFISLLIGNAAYRFSNNIITSIVIFAAAFIPVSEISVGIVNLIISHTLPPAFLPKMEYKNGIPKEFTTAVIVPTILPDSKRVKELINQLEVTYIASKENNVYFAIVGDLKDSDSKECERDKEIISTGLKLTRELNNKYPSEEDIFYFFVRDRKLNSCQNRWMGWERKRGAIVEFNELIRSSQSTSFSTVSGSIEPLKKVKYIITLDADTILPLGSAKKLIGTISHPINIAHFNEKEGRVTHGYGLIQPRININITSSNKSIFSRIFAGEGGVDPYSSAVSDVYQDMFGEGIFTGKGIFDVDIFRRCLNERIPENSVLSHDLLEGCFLRVGLATDIEMIDSFPEKYSSYILRLHRWIRGDWQLIRWLMPYIRISKNKSIKNNLSPLSKWKIFDNLRRSIAQKNLFYILLFGLLLIPYSGYISIAFTLLVVMLPFMLDIINLITFGHIKISKANNTAIRGIKASFFRGILQFIFIPYSYYIISDAILRTLYRVFISKENLLEWVTAAEVEKNSKNDVKSYFRQMHSIYLLSGLIFILIFLFNRINLPYALLLGAIFSISPIEAYRISLTIPYVKEPVNKDVIDFLRKIARKTWAFYEDYAGDEDNFLPVDNVQFNPVEKIAHRTSPTNIGFLIMSTISARDFGYLTTTSIIEKLNKTLKTIDALEKWNGHLYNWYDTRSLCILSPKYVSTVDSGNFIGYLITTREALINYTKTSLIGIEMADGLMDTLKLAEGVNNSHINILENFIYNKKINIQEWYPFLNHILINIKGNDIWKSKLRDFCNSSLKEIDSLFPEYIFKMDAISFIEENNIYSKINMYLKDVIKNPTPSNMSKIYKGLIEEINNILTNDIKPTETEILILFKENLVDCLKNTETLLSGISETVSRLDSIIKSTEFIPLYNKKRELFSIGYNIESDRLTDSYYDLLASEARITSYIAACRREIPASHWFKLGRSLVLVDNYRSLVSWSGTMFEYFMPALVMKNFNHTLLDETYKTVINAQIKYGKSRGLPWGTSESGYYTFDLLLNYQYRAFGVPDLGLKRGLINDMVISPYSTVLALPFYPKAASENLNSLSMFGAEGTYGFYEALDFTPDRLPYNKDFALVESFMAHHQGMILASINNYINDNALINRFHSNPIIKAGEVLLQEKIPQRVIITKEHKEIVEPFIKPNHFPVSVVRRAGYDLNFPICHILSNGRYYLMIDNKGCGFSRYEDIDVTRWRRDIPYGMFFYIREVHTGRVWSNTFEPMKIIPDSYEAKFSSDKIQFIRRDGDIETHTDICVSPEDNCEIRKITVINHKSEDIIIECTSFSETVISSHHSDLAHPAFNNLFVMTEFLNKENTILSLRHPRKFQDSGTWSFHTMVVDGDKTGTIEYETDRYKFIGRNNDVSNPYSISKPLSNTSGVVLDPSLSLRSGARIPSNKSAVFVFTTGIADSRDKALELVSKYDDISNIERAFELAYIRSQMETRFLNLVGSEIEFFDNMISHIIYTSPSKGKYQKYLMENKKGQPSLWPYGISGDLPIILLSIKDSDNIDTVKLMIKAHEYYRMKGLKVDLVILNEDEGSYLQPLQDLIRDVVSSGNSRDVLDKFGGIFIRNASNIPNEDRTLLYAVASLIINANGTNIVSQLKYRDNVELPPASNFKKEDFIVSKDEIPMNLLFFNGYGGFNPSSYEYIIMLRDGINTPAPWVNIISNKNFGTMVTEAGSGFTWSENSRENKLTVWSNDPILDTQSEAVYIRDNLSGNIFSPTIKPIRDNGVYTISHGLGYTKFSHACCSIKQDLLTFVPVNDKVKISLLKLKNTSEKARDISIYYYIKPVLGVSSETTSFHVITEYDELSRTIFATNPYNTEFKNRTAFITSSENINSFTCDAIEFIGVNGEISHPAGLQRGYLSGKAGATINSCCVIQIKINLKENEEKEIALLLGQGTSKSEAIEILSKYNNNKECRKAFASVKKYWRDLVSTIHVNTPDAAMNIMLNSYLLYQTLACRIWARAAFYQCGGAYGFRDQLQDSLSIVYIAPEITRNQIILHSSHQFVDGDVQHWWHPGCCDKGIRTRYSDDLLWLPYTVIEYVKVTGDYSILDEVTSYLEDSPLKEGEDERYGTPKISTEKSAIFEHCVRAIKKSLEFGEHGIPLMGSGDWNDGMNTVGNKGKGESVWLGWFLYDILIKFSKLCEYKGNIEMANDYLKFASNIKNSIDNNAWDGQWYTRAFFDDGTPLGSSVNTECKIDSIVQSWAVMSNGGKEEHIKPAMKSVEDYLVKRDDGIILLFTPPFDKGPLNPGYIKGYVPGVRENGGQYTHAAAWVIYAMCTMGLGIRAFEYFSMVNPINHTRTTMECTRYKAEPYVMAADVYSVEGQRGRGGWSWYTGSASWMYKAGLEGILGFKKNGNKLYIEPCIPKEWNEYSIEYKYNNTKYNIEIKRTTNSDNTVKEIVIDGKISKENFILLQNNDSEHFIQIKL